MYNSNLDQLLNHPFFWGPHKIVNFERKRCSKRYILSSGTYGILKHNVLDDLRDVHSFGVILLELLTGKEPTGPEFKDMEGGNLVGWVQLKIKNCQAIDVLDLSVLDTDSKQIMHKTLHIAVVCLSENPASRPTMLHVLKLLKEIKDE